MLPATLNPLSNYRVSLLYIKMKPEADCFSPGLLL